jgi:hypothetical protein
VGETRKLAAILVSDVVGYSRLAGADEDRTLARLRALRSDLIDPAISVHRGRIVKRTGDGSVIEFRSVVDAVRCALEVQHAMVERNAGLALDRTPKFSPSPAPERSTPPRLSLVVLPFANISGAPSKSISSMASPRASRPAAHGYAAPLVRPNHRRR